MREIISLVDRLVVLVKGKVAVYDTPKVVLGHKFVPVLKKIGFPDFLHLHYELQKAGVQIDAPVVTFEDTEL